MGRNSSMELIDMSLGDSSTSTTISSGEIWGDSGVLLVSGAGSAVGCSSMSLLLATVRSLRMFLMDSTSVVSIESLS